jgi:(2Fe-2S) ferredoxin
MITPPPDSVPSDGTPQDATALPQTVLAPGLMAALQRGEAPVTQARLTHHVFVCTGTACSRNASETTLLALRTELARHGLLYGKHGSQEGRVIVTTCGSIGFCAMGPAVLVYPQGHWYAAVQASDVPEWVEQVFIRNLPYTPLLAHQLA